MAFKGKVRSERAEMAFCAVPSCAQFSEQLVFATPKVFTYYAFKNKKPDNVKVCPACFEKAELYHKVN